ncbi:MAG: hypothetical protein GY714_29065 [Desulfobacterales bacterium]|nr:hypothetical protein [Desulfobacterales bacterium]MCP4163209.1 hypothetical protein [Deltaproteobacteria bacterium]
MKRTILNILIACFVVTLFSGCNFFHSSYTVSMSNSYKDLEIGTYAILPFKDQRNGRVKKKTPDAANVMSDSFETAFLDTGFRVVERSKVNKVLKEMKFSHQGYVDDTQLKKIGKLTNSDAIIVGLVRVFQGPEFKNPEDHEDATKCSSISFSVKAIHVETGEILWKGSISKSTGFSDDVLYGCEYEVYRYADKIAGSLMEEIMKKIRPEKKTPPKNKKQTEE